MPRCASNIDPSIQMLVPCGISSSASSVKFIVKRFGTFPTISEGSTLTTVGHRVKVAIIRQTACSPFLCYLPYMRRCLCCSYGLPWLSEKVSIPRRASQEFGQLRGPQNPRIAALVPDRGDPGRAWRTNSLLKMIQYGMKTGKDFSGTRAMLNKDSFKRGGINPAAPDHDICCNVIMVASQIRHSADIF